jgi:3-oxoacyl-[acyl-carrier-protein] synthase-3
MAFLQTHHCRIRSIAAAVPPKILENKDYEWLTEPERELFIKTTGIARRHMAEAGVCTSDLCVVAAEKIISDLAVDRSEIDLLVFVSQSPDYLFPATSIIIQNRLQLGKHVMAFDISLGCSGYVYGLSVVSSLMESGKFRKAFLMVGDISTHAQNYKDKSAYPLFGDAGTTTLLEYSEKGEMSFVLHSDGSGYKTIMKPDGGVRSPITVKSFEEKEYETGVVRTPNNIHMSGLDVFNFSTTEAPASIKELFTQCHVTNDEIDYFIFHQANKLMNETIRKKLKIDAAKVPYSLQDFGNTSSASIPLTLVHCLRNELKDSKRKICISGFGVGLSWANAIIELDHVYCPEVIIA